MRVTDVARCLNFRRGGAAAMPSLILMTDDVRLADPLPAVLGLPAGAAVILRHYATADRRRLARRLIAAARPKGIRVLIAGDARLALAVGADGLHLPAALAARGPGAWTRWRRPGWLVTAAAHSPAALRRAKRAGADAALLAPVFRTASHPKARPIGPIRFARWCRESPLPVYALGGVDGARARRLRRAGAVGFAGIGGFTAGRRRRPEGPGN